MGLDVNLPLEHATTVLALMPTRAAGVERLLVSLQRALGAEGLLAHVALMFFDAQVHLDVAPQVRLAEELGAALIAVEAARDVPLVDDLVLGQQRPRAEGAAAVLALVRPFASVDTLVHRHVVLLQERLAAVAASVGLLARVGLLVLSETSLSLEGEGAAGAFEGPVSPVGRHVSCQRARLAEAAAALLAGEWLLPGMHSDVLPHRGLVGERLIAVVALVRLLAQVNVHVDVQRVPGGEGLAAVAAGVGLFAGVRAHVVLEVLLTPKGLPTHLTRLRPAVLVNVAMLLKVPGQTEAFATKFTLVRFFSCVRSYVAFQTCLISKAFLTKITNYQTILHMIIKMFSKSFFVGTSYFTIKTCETFDKTFNRCIVQLIFFSEIPRC